MRWVLLLCVLGAPAWSDPAALAALNQFRAGEGRAALVYDAKLERAARQHAEDMVRNGFFAHRGSDGSDVGARVRSVGYRWCFAAENIAKGQRGLGEVLSAWAASPGHRRNLLSRKARAFGLHEASERTWVMVLAAPC